MGYACPVCGTPQRDGEHLANHLAFTAMLRGEAHESWLDEHVPDWDEGGPDDLAERVVPLATETEYEEVFEDTVADQRSDRGGRPEIRGHDHGHDHAHDHDHFDDAPFATGESGPGLDDEARSVLEEARDLTREMLDGGETPDQSAAGPDDGPVDDSEEGRTGDSEDATTSADGSSAE